ncbi:MAG: hypothetical protein ACOYM3_02460 [Terrimicrobiaceae bacterium]
MSNPLIKPAVRALFLFTRRERALNQAIRALRKYLALADGVSLEAGACEVEVPPLPGVDEDMRRWSFYMILQHNIIVNRSISATVRQLCSGETLSGAAAIDPKRDVMPHPSAGGETIRQFQESVNEHVGMVKTLGRLRGTKTSRHPLFGQFDAHQWNCMFSFHLGLHYAQAEHVIREANARRERLA